MFVSALHRICTNEETFLLFIDMNTGECLLFIIINLSLRPFDFRSSIIKHGVIWKIELPCKKHLLFVVFVFIFTIFYLFKEIYHCAILIWSSEKNCLRIYVFPPFSILLYSDWWKCLSCVFPVLLEIISRSQEPHMKNMLTRNGMNEWTNLKRSKRLSREP